MTDLVEYYRRRAGEYEVIYAKPERQAELARLRQLIPDRLRGRRVLEVACGTGYWTVPIARAAAEVLATDISEEPLRIARAKRLPEGRVQFRLADAFAFGASLGSFDAAFAGFWWFDGLAATRKLYLAGVAARRPSLPFLLVDVACFAIALASSPAASSRDCARRRPSRSP